MPKLEPSYSSHNQEQSVSCDGNVSPLSKGTTAKIMWKSWLAWVRQTVSPPRCSVSGKVLELITIYELMEVLTENFSGQDCQLHLLSGQSMSHFLADALAGFPSIYCESFNSRGSREYFPMSVRWNSSVVCTAPMICT